MNGTESATSKAGFQAWRVGTKLIALTIPLIAAASLVAAFAEYKRNTANLQEKLTQRARSLHTQIMADRGYYAKVIVPRLIALGGTIGLDYQSVHGRFPLPATFVREVSEITASHKNGFLWEHGWADNDIGIVWFQRDGRRYAYAISFFTEGVAVKYADIPMGQRVSSLAWQWFAGRYGRP